PAGSAVLRDNIVLDSSGMGLEVRGQVRALQIVGNRIHNPVDGGLYINRLAASSRNILLANNTVHRGLAGLVVNGDPPKGDNIQVMNNLFLHTTVDRVCLVNADRPSTMQAGDGSAPGEKRRRGHNRRGGE